MAFRVSFAVLAALGLGLSASAQQVDAPLNPVNAQVETEWMGGPRPGEWCATHQRYLADLKERGVNPPDAACAPNGPCDDPAGRNASIPTLATPIKTYRLSIHIFRDDNGTNSAATQADVDTAVVRLNTNYAPWRIQFIAQTNFINSTRYRTLDAGEETGMKRTYADSPATKLNIYVVSTPNGVCWGKFPWVPEALGLQGGVVMEQYWFVAASPIPSILTHEVGHCLGLWHTHHGVSEVPQCSDCYEAAGRTAAQGDVTGDWCSDTNPSPTNSNNCFDPPELDPCTGNPWVSTPYLNYMSYSHACPAEFTPQQAGRMHCWTADVLSSWLQLPMPPAAPGTPTLTKLAGGQVRVAWADNSANEDGFRVQREKKSGSSWINTLIIATVGANTASVTDAPGAGTFRYRVQAFNKFGDSAWSEWKQVNN